MYPSQSTGDENIASYKPGKNLEHDVCMIYLITLRGDFDSFLRCHESARIFCDVLKRYGHSITVVDGHYVHDGKKLLHSWVEFADLDGTKIIETTPQQVSPKLLAKEPVKSLVISQDDKRFTRYQPMSTEEFLQCCKTNGIRIDENKVKRLSEVISRAIAKLSTKRRKDKER